MNIVIVFPKKEVALKINNILIRNGLSVAVVCGSGARALQAIKRLEGGIIVSGIRYPDLIYRDIKDELSDDFEMLVIGSQSQWEEYGDNDVIFLSTPFKAYELVELVEDFCWTLEKRKKKKQKKPKERSEADRGLIERAKGYVMTAHNWSEEEAHRYLQKNSMDMGRSLVETAACIIQIYQEDGR